MHEQMFQYLKRTLDILNYDKYARSYHYTSMYSSERELRKDSDIRLAYSDESGRLMFEFSGWKADFIKDYSSRFKESAFCSIEIDPLTDTLHIDADYDDFMAFDRNTMIELDLPYPLSEEQYFQYSLIHDIPLEYSSLCEIIDFMKQQLPDLLT